MPASPGLDDIPVPRRYWWRAQSVAYLMRFNERTLQARAARPSPSIGFARILDTCDMIMGYQGS